MRSLIIAALMVAGAITVLPSAQAGPVCVSDPLPEHVQACVSTEVCVVSQYSCFDATSPKDVARWVKDQLGPCTCPPPNEPW